MCIRDSEEMTSESNCIVSCIPEFRSGRWLDFIDDQIQFGTEYYAHIDANFLARLMEFSNDKPTTKLERLTAATMCLAICANMKVNPTFATHEYAFSGSLEPDDRLAYFYFLDNTHPQLLADLALGRIQTIQHKHLDRTAHFGSQPLSNTALDVNQGVESALADFDAQFTSSAFWTTNDEPRNVNPLLGNQFDQSVFQQDTVQWQSEIAKKTANGTQIFFRNVNTYTENNVPLVSDPAPNTGFQNLDSWYRTSLELELRQPLLRGRGAFIQRMPIVISRIGTDQELANLEAQLQNMVTNVEIRYWDLYCACRCLLYTSPSPRDRQKSRMPSSA